MTLDVEMPRMDGLTFLERLMRLHPMPVVMVSSQTERDAEASLRALELGAVDVIAKPRASDAQGLTEFAAMIAESLRAAAKGTDNLLPPIRESLRAMATVGEVCGVMRDVFGTYKPRR